MSENSVSNVKTFPIVGSYYRPPAKLILEHLAIDTPMYLEAEPTNPYDVNAIAVYLESKDIPEATLKALEPLLPACGHSLESLEDMKTIHLGYIPKELAKILRGRDFHSADGTFTTSSSGTPQIKFIDPSKPMPQDA